MIELILINMIKKIKKKFRRAFLAFSYGLKNTESDIFGQKIHGSESNSIEQKMQQNELGEALLKGEVTEEVEKLRDRTYLVVDEAKKYKVIIDTVGESKSVKKLQNKIHPRYFNEIGYDVVMSMDNNIIPSSVIEGLNSVGGYGIKNNHPLKFEYKYAPKFQLSDYIKKFVVRKNNDNELRIDLYVPFYVDSFERINKIFDNELNKIKTNERKPFNIEFDNLSFVSNKAFGTDDLVKYEYAMKNFIGINEYDGGNVLTYIVENIGSSTKITDKYKNQKLRDSYENNESRGTKLNLGLENKEKHKCERCGGDVYSDYDFRITKKTNGIGLCQNCLKKEK